MAAALTLYVAERDFRVHKLEVAAAAAGIALSVSVVPKERRGEVLKKTPQGVFPILSSAHGSISGSNAILRYLATLREDEQLAGYLPFESAQIDEWLEYGFRNVESYVTALQTLKNSTTSSSKQVGKAATSHDSTSEITSSLAITLAELDTALQAKTFLVGERFSLADIAIATAINAIFHSLVVKPDGSVALPHLARWFFTCRYVPCMLRVLGEPAAASSSGAPAAPISAPQAASASAGTVPTTVLANPKFRRNRERIADILALAEGAIGRSITVCGWSKTTREAGAGKLLFVSLNDGSCFDSLQVVAEAGKTEGFEAAMKAGGIHASFRIVGTVAKSPAKGQPIELHATAIEVLGAISDPAEYPLPKGRHSVEYLREILHLRPRSNLIGAVQRIRNACAFATHTFFQQRGFSYVHTPIITGSDCEGAGEMFQVTTVLPADPSKDVPRTKDGKVDYSKDFFAKPAFLTVSGQLQVESFAEALSDVYTFGPTFRAEDSHTSRHLAEFWMIEPEISFATLEDDMALAEDYLKFCTQFVLENCPQDLKFFQDQVEPGLLARLHNVATEPFQRLTYTEAIELLTSPEHAAAGKFEVKPYWGIDLASEHERYITERVFKKPVILINYPKDIKAFYMKLNPDEKTVAAMDVLVPKVGEIIGGSQREDDFAKLQKRMAEMGVAEEGLKWYLDLRKYGSVPHAGFGLGFERLVMYVTGLENIRDAIPFPRWPGNALL